jgi:tRNA modification GTPase
MYAADTIAAITTPPGPGGIGIVRVSGPLSTDLAAHLFAGREAAANWVSHMLYLGLVRDAGGRAIDRGLAVLMRAPQSYTGEDVLELHCHGGPVVMHRVLTAVLRSGARLAEAGEFTKRAFLNGRLDLAQAEAVIDIVRARSDQASDIALAQLSGLLSSHLNEVRADLIRLKAFLEAQIDFADEDLAIDDEEVELIFGSAENKLKQLVASYEHGRLRRDGVVVPIVGRPNVGKSSLLNALLGEDRAIVTPMPGTTRDTIEESITVDGVPVLLADTAGLRGSTEADQVERLGMERTTAKIAGAHMVLFVVDASQPLRADDRLVANSVQGRPTVVVANKCDLASGLPEGDLGTLAGGNCMVRVSATAGLGLDALREAIARTLGASRRLPADCPIVSSARHHATLVQAAERLGMAHTALSGGVPPELVAVDVQEAIDQIATITGGVTSEDVLDRIFADFCIGK